MRITLTLASLVLTTLAACQSAELGGADEADASAATIATWVSCDAAFTRLNAPPPTSIGFEARLAIIGPRHITAASFPVDATPTSVASHDPYMRAETEFRRVVAYAELERRTQLLAGRTYPYAVLNLSFLNATVPTDDVEETVRVSSCAVDGDRVVVKAAWADREATVVYAPYGLGG